MDDFVISSLHESKNEWVSRLIYVLTPHIIEGMRSIFDEAVKLCRDNNEMEKYLMTFQNFVSRIPKWNENIIETETKRIVERSACKYLNDLITCVHIIQLKLLSAIRVGQKQKKININIPRLNDFVHKVYVHLARKVYKNVYLYELNVSPLKQQRNLYNLERIVEECIAHAVRESIPLESLLQAYMDESVEEEVVEEVKEEILSVEPLMPPSSSSVLSSQSNPGAAASKVLSEMPTASVMTLSSAIPLEETASLSSLSSREAELLDIPDLAKVDLGGGSDLSAPLSLESASFLQPSAAASGRLTFNDSDYVRDTNNQDGVVMAPKTIDRLEEISRIRHEQSKLEEEGDDGGDGGFKLRIGEDISNVDGLKIQSLDSLTNGSAVDIFSDIEELQ